MGSDQRWSLLPLTTTIALLLPTVLIGCGRAPGQRPAPAAPGDSATQTGTPPAPAPPTTGPRLRRLPPANATFDYQIGGAYPPAAAAGIVDRDRNDAPATGRYNICYINAFQTQPTENQWWKSRHDDLLLKKNNAYVEDPNWPGEIVLDLSTNHKRAAITAIVDGWLAGCATKGFHAVEPDNLDSWTRSKDLLTRDNSVAYARLLAAKAHARGLAIAQKNTAQLSPTGRTVIGFDFAIAEECAVFNECADYLAAYGDQVYEIEYTDNPDRHYHEACRDHGARISIILRDRNVVPDGDPAHRYQTC